MELAAMSGQAAVVSDALAALRTRSVATFQAEMGRRMRSMADCDLALSRRTNQIAAEMGAVGHRDYDPEQAARRRRAAGDTATS
jgi:hypothetical protein